MDNTAPRKARIIKANKDLQNKIGVVVLDAGTVAASQTVIDSNDVDFTPQGLSILDDIDLFLKHYDLKAVADDKIRESLIASVMELKANAAVFRYVLVGNLATVMLGFLESLDHLDQKAIDIVRAHHKTLHMIIVRKMTGDGGPSGEMLMRELQSVCNRYHKAVRAS